MPHSSPISKNSSPPILQIVLYSFPILFLILTLFLLFFPSLLHVLDNSLGTFILSWRSNFLTAFFTVFTSLGGTTILTLGSVFIGIITLWLFKKIFFPFLIAIGGSALFTHLTKLLFERDRPEEGLVIATSFSFPSGHTANSTAFYGFLAFLIFIRLPRKRQKIILLLSVSFFLFLMGFSRIYLGVHFTSDVLGGYIMGGWWLALAIFAYRHTA